MNILAQLLDEKIARDRLSERTAARDIGISPTTVGRIKRGEPVDVDTLIKVCTWLGVSPATILNSYTPNTGIVESVSAILEAHPQLSLMFLEAIEAVRGGTIPPSTLQDIIAYTSFRITAEGQKNAKSSNIEVFAGG